MCFSALKTLAETGLVTAADRYFIMHEGVEDHSVCLVTALAFCYQGLAPLRLSGRRRARWCHVFRWQQVHNWNKKPECDKKWMHCAFYFRKTYAGVSTLIRCAHTYRLHQELLRAWRRSQFCRVQWTRRTFTAITKTTAGAMSLAQEPDNSYLFTFQKNASQHMIYPKSGQGTRSTSTTIGKHMVTIAMPSLNSTSTQQVPSALQIFTLPHGFWMKTFSPELAGQWPIHWKRHWTLCP